MEPFFRQGTILFLGQRHQRLQHDWFADPVQEAAKIGTFDVEPARARNFLGIGATGQ